MEELLKKFEDEKPEVVFEWEDAKTDAKTDVKKAI